MLQFKFLFISEYDGLFSEKGCNSLHKCLKVNLKLLLCLSGGFVLLLYLPSLPGGRREFEPHGNERCYNKSWCQLSRKKSLSRPSPICIGFNKKNVFNGKFKVLPKRDIYIYIIHIYTQCITLHIYLEPDFQIRRNSTILWAMKGKSYVILKKQE